MTSDTEYALYLVTYSVAEQFGLTLAEAGRLSDPLVYWIATPRASGRMEMAVRHLSKRQVAALARRVHNAGGCYDTCISVCRTYLGSLIKDAD